MSNIDVARDNASSNVPDTLITINLNEPSSTTTTNDGQSEQQPAAAATVAPPEELNPSTGSQRSLNSRMFPFRLSRDIILQNVSYLIAIVMTHCIHVMFTLTNFTINQNSYRFRFFRKFDR